VMQEESCYYRYDRAFNLSSHIEKTQETQDILSSFLGAWEEALVGS